jgi:flagellar hook-length control protein FliK
MAEGPSGSSESPPAKTRTSALIPEKASALPPTVDANSHGTVAAKQQQDMTRALKLNEFAASAEQILPREFTPFEDSQVEEALHRVDSPTRGLESHYIQWNPVSPCEVAALDKVEPAPSAPTATNELYHSVLEQAAILKHVRADSMTVVLKPDALTEILLQLSKTEDGISATLRVDRGHVAALADDWAHLANSLAHQGVQLTSSSENSDSARGGHSDRHQAPRGFGMDDAAETPRPKSKTKGTVSAARLPETSGALEFWA